MKKHIILIVSIIAFNLPLNAQWNQLGTDLDGESPNDNFGSSLCLSADGLTIAVGAYENDENGSASGNVRIFKQVAGVWAQVGEDILGEAAGDKSGYAVSLSGDGLTAAIGSPLNEDNGYYSGHVRIFKYISGTWEQQGSTIDGQAANDVFGQSVSLNADGSIVAISAPGHSNRGNVRVFENLADTWVQLGSDIEGEAAGDNLGREIELSSDGSVLAIGAYFNDGNGSNSGHVRVYSYNAEEWVQEGEDIDGEFEGDHSGFSVSLSSNGSTVAIGSPRNEENGVSSGQVRVYKNLGGNWEQLGEDMHGEAVFDHVGYSVSLSSNGLIVAIGAPWDNANGHASGRVQVYKYVTGTWIQYGDAINGEFANDKSGFSVDLNNDGTIVAIGSTFNSLSTGHVRVYTSGTVAINEISSNSNQVYPNPTKNTLYFENSGLDITAVSIINLSGKIVREITLIDHTIDVSLLSPGIYFLRIKRKNGISELKFVKE